MKRLILISFLFLNSFSESLGQDCIDCGERTAIGFDKIEWLGIQKPEDPILLEQWDKLAILWPEISYRYDQHKNNHCVYVRQTGKGTQNQDVTKLNYKIYGIITKSVSDYVLKLWMQPSCSDKILGEREIRFQLYPVMDIDQIAQQAATEISSLVKLVEEFESNERDLKNYGLGGDLWGGRILITMENKMVKGEVTRAVLRVVDCDNRVLNNKEISTEGTSGGIFTPAKFKTDDEGEAIVKFKMNTDKTAIVKASCETKNVWGCEDLYTGTEAIKGIEGAPIKVSILYNQDETKTLKRMTLPGVKIKGGEEVEMTQMMHRTVFYHYPTAASLNQGFLIETVEDDSPAPAVEKKNLAPRSRTEYVTESGWYSYSKNIANAKISGMVGDVEMVSDEEKGEEIKYIGDASLQHNSKVTFYKGDVNNPPQFYWEIEYPVSNDGLAFGIAIIIKGEEGVKWLVNKITDPKSIYKTEYLLSLTKNAAEELKKGNKAMKDLFGVDLDDMTKMVDPTNPQSDMAGASGSQTITVRILSPFPEK